MNERILVLYGSVTGNSEICATRTAKALRKRGHDPVVVEDMSHAKASLLKEYGIILVVTSTYGDGEPPDGCEAIYEMVVKDDSFRLEQAPRFSVLSLGDTSYEQFCQCGKEYDEALGRAGGVRLSPRVDCDTDYDDGADAWTEAVLQALELQRTGV